MKIRTLVVDDEDVLRGVIEQVLDDDGFDVTTASSAEQALELYRADPFPVVVTDIVMGKMSGIELLTRIKEIDSEALVIVMTSHAALETAIEALRVGAHDYLVKPFDDISLISTVVERAAGRYKLLLDNRRLMDQLQRQAEELRELNLRLTSMANRDGLTGLYNHRYFREALCAEIVRSRRHGRTFSLIFADLDNFKERNDTQGHLAGDALIRGIAAVFQDHARESTVVARYGGDEFVLLVPETGTEGAAEYAERMRHSVADSVFAGEQGERMTQTISLGVASFPDHADNTTDLIEKADRALYLAKAAGKNSVHCWSAEDEEKRAPTAPAGVAEPA